MWTLQKFFKKIAWRKVSALTFFKVPQNETGINQKLFCVLLFLSLHLKVEMFTSPFVSYLTEKCGKWNWIDSRIKMVK